MGDIRSLNVVRANRKNDNTLLSPAECFEEAARETRSGERKCDKALVLTLDTEDGAYGIGFYASNLKASEMIALLEATKAMFLRDMGY